MTFVTLVPPDLQALQQEIPLHPKLLDQLNYPGAVKSFEDGIAIIAMYCDVVLHGEYQAVDLNHLFKILTDKLVSKRTIIIVD